MAVAYKKLQMVETPMGVFGISPSMGTIWMPHKKTGMPCLQVHGLKDDDEHTGIYCLKKPDAREMDGYAGDKVQLWVSGLLFPYENGYRAEKAIVTGIVEYMSPGSTSYNFRSTRSNLHAYLTKFIDERGKMSPEDLMKRALAPDASAYAKGFLD